VFSVGFQLSFIAVAGIILFTAKIARALLWGLGWIKARLSGELGGMEFERYAKLRIMEAEGLMGLRNAGFFVADWLALGVATSLSAWAATTPLVAYHFGNFSPLLPLTNLLLMALMFAALAIGFLVMVGVAPYALIAGAAPVFLPQWFGSVPLLEGSGVVTHIFARLSWRNVPAFSIFAVLACYAALAMLPLLRKVRIFRVACPAFLLVAAGLVGWQFAFGGAKGLEVAILDVGLGSANVVQFPDGRVLIFDCGSVGNGTGRYDVVPYLRQAGVTRIDAIIVSHPHGDHFEGLSDIIDRYPVGCVVITRYFDVERYPVWAAVEKKIRERGVEIFVIGEGGRLANFPEARFFLADFDVGRGAASDTGESEALTNNMSLAMEIRAEGAAALFTADMEESAIAHFLSARGEGPVDVMTAPHHGQYLDAATDSLLAEVRPRAVVVSSNGSRAKFAGAARANGAEVFETRRGGAVIFEARDGSIAIRSFRQRGKDG
jgi:competence protein ComEC